MLCRWCNTEVGVPCSEKSKNKVFSNLLDALFNCIHYKQDEDTMLPAGSGVGSSFDLTGLVVTEKVQ